MGEYLAPDIYVEKRPSGQATIQGASTTTAGFVGVTERGERNKPVFVTSWEDYKRKFALGMDSPFYTLSLLAYSVYGYFQNGGKRCYILSIAKDSVAKKATIDIGTINKVVVEALEEGEWGNKLKVKVTANIDTPANFDIVILLKDKEVEKFVSITPTGAVDIESDFVKFKTGTLVSGDVALAGGVNGISELIDGDFALALDKFDTVARDISMFAIPSQSTQAIASSLRAYCEKWEIMPFYDMPMYLKPTEAKTYRANLGGEGVVYYPHIKVVDPLSPKLKDCPVSGHAMGVHARIISQLGIGKTAGGTKANVRGAVDVGYLLSEGDIALLNPVSVNCVVPITNNGVTLWGARSLSSNPDFLYFNSIHLSNYVSKSLRLSTNWAVFEDNNEILWTALKTASESFLDLLFRDKQLQGTIPKEAYFVKCDGELNNQAVIDSGRVYCDVYYAPNKPSEFVIFRLSHLVKGGK